MADYFVRTTGSDAAAGTSAGAAWLTVDKAANTVAAGDTVYIGAGVYRELVTMDTSGTSGNAISFIADIDGSKTGDAGLVIISAYDTDTAAPARANTLILSSREYIEWYDVIFDGGTSNSISADAAGNNTYEGIVFDGCVFMAYTAATATISFNFNASATPTGSGPILRNCGIAGNITFQFDENATALTDWKMAIENCIFVGHGRGTTNIAIRFLKGSTSTFDAGGCDINNCTITGYANAIYATGCDNTTDTIAIANTLIMHCQNGIYRFQGTSGAVVSSGGNRILDVDTPFTGVTADGSDSTTGSFGLVGGIADLPLYRKLGWSPFKPWEPISMSGYASPLIDAGSATYAPATDMYGNARPMGTADDVGAVESNPRGARSATWAADASTYSMAFTAIGYYESMIPVDAVSTTISVKAYKDASYTGTAPKLEVFIGNTSQGTDSMVVANEVEETLSVNFTPSSAGWARVRLYSYATAGTVFFDSMAVA